MTRLKLIAFDLDGTLTQHKSKLISENKAMLDRLSEKYRLLMVGAGQCLRIFRQMDGYPIDIIGNYGMQYGVYNPATRDLDIVWDIAIPCDKEKIERSVTRLRERYHFTEFAGENVEYHPSGCLTIPLLGTKAELEKKLAFDPTREIRRKMYEEVRQMFPDYNVFVGGSSSFDLAPKPYDKRYALDRYRELNGLAVEEVVYVGDDYGLGGNDEAVFRSGYRFVCVDDYRDFPKIMAPFLL